MTCGIYKLHFATDNEYIGQSTNIEKRISKHKTNLLSNNASIKMQEAFNTFGMFTYDIVCECTTEELDVAEKEAIEIFDTYYNGLNSRLGGATGDGLFGESHPNSIFSNTQIRHVFNLLVQDSDIGYKKIAELTNTNISLVKDIKTGKRHTWLRQEYPDTYPLLKLIDVYSGRNSAEKQGKRYPVLYSPDGKEYYVSNVSAFSKEHGLHCGHLNSVLNGKAKTVKGWHI